MAGPSLKSQSAALRALLKGGLKGGPEALAIEHARAAAATLGWVVRDGETRATVERGVRLRFAVPKCAMVARYLAREVRLDMRDAGNKAEIAADAVAILDWLDANAEAIRTRVAERKAARERAS